MPNQPVIRISQVNSSLQVITSKQRPRKLCITGSNGKEYMFLLKGHEDLRQDERVMQLFSLVNTLLIHDPETFRRNLTIQVRMQILFTLWFYVLTNFLFLFKYRDMQLFLCPQIVVWLVGFPIVTLYIRWFVITERRRKSCLILSTESCFELVAWKMIDSKHIIDN